MERIAPLAKIDAIEWVVNRLPLGMKRILNGVHFIKGCDPVWMGVSTNKYVGFDNTTKGRKGSFCNWSHCCLKWGLKHLPLNDRETTIVIGSDIKKYEDERKIILHELGHVLDERLIEIAIVEKLKFYRPGCVPLDDYAAINGGEAFATSFQSWMTINDKNEEYFHTRNEVLK